MLTAFKQLQLSLRSLKRDRIFSMVNILGLSLGMVGCAFMFLYVSHALSYDHYHQEVDHIYRINSSWVGGDSKKSMAITSQSIAPHLQENYSQINAAARISLMNENPDLIYDGQKYQTKNFRMTDREVFDIFTFKFVAGTKETAFNHPGDLVISSSWAKRIFGNTDCLGETVKSGNNQYTVTAVYEDWPQNIHLPLNGLIYREFGSDNWEQFAYFTYVHTESHSQLAGILNEVSDGYYKAKANNGEYILLEAQPLKGLHFARSIVGDMPKGNLTYTRLFLAAGIILLVVMLVNVSNMGVIRSIVQLQKTGLKKILGASRPQIIYSHLMDLAVLFFISWIISITLFQVVSPYFTELSGIDIKMNEHLSFLLLLSAGFLGLVLFTGLYGVSITSGIQPSYALRKIFYIQIPGTHVRKGLVVFQFVITGLLVSGLMVLLVQWNYIKNKDVGFNSRDVLVVSLNRPDLNITVVQNKLTDLIGNRYVSLGSWGTIPGSDLPFTTATFHQQSDKLEIPINIIDFDANFPEVFEIPVLQGNLPGPLHEEELRKGGSQGVLINQTLANLLEKPMHQELSLPWMTGRIDGIIHDYHYQSLHNHIEPLALVPMRAANARITHLFLKADYKHKKVIEKILLENWSPADFSLEYLDKKLLSNYKQEQRAISMIRYFALLSLFISSVGLFGIVAYALKQRVYEIGIRKVLGASLMHLIVLFGREILLLLVLAIVVTFPLAVFLKRKIFELYAFQPDLNDVWLILPGLLSSVLAFTFILIQIRWADQVNPASLLRNE